MSASLTNSHSNRHALNYDGVSTPALGAHCVANRDSELSLLLPECVFDEPLWKSLFQNVDEFFFPKKLPPLVVTSKPLPVNDIWGFDDYRKNAVLVSTMAHVTVLAAIISITMLARRVVQQVTKPQATVTLVSPDDIFTSPPSKEKAGGGGGGGDRDKLQAPKGKLPKFAMHQIVPPAVVVRNDHPKLAAEPTVVVPPEIHLAAKDLPSLGDPMSPLLAAPPSNGPGYGGGIGSGSGGGVGSGEGPGVGPGRGGGIGGGDFHNGGIFRVGGEVSPPRPIYTPDPDYSEEARKARYQGVCILWLVVDSTGRTRDVQVARSLGLGLDEKAIDAVKRWTFEPATKNGKPVAVRVNVEVTFRLY
ncbi:MAG TPA: energy transducer TonB [Terriglobales bacterium]|nr:energy transducer TonB [Terriglobales bacterium]